MTVIDSKPSSELPASKGKERNAVALTALISGTAHMPANSFLVLLSDALVLQFGIQSREWQES